MVIHVSASKMTMMTELQASLPPFWQQLMAGTWPGAQTGLLLLHLFISRLRHLILCVRTATCCYRCYRTNLWPRWYNGFITTYLEGRSISALVTNTRLSLPQLQKEYHKGVCSVLFFSTCMLQISLTLQAHLGLINHPLQMILPSGPCIVYLSEWSW